MANPFVAIDPERPEVLGVDEIVRSLNALDALAADASSLSDFYPQAIAVANATLGSQRANVWSGLDRARPAPVWRTGEAEQPRGEHGFVRRIADWATNGTDGPLPRAEPSGACDVLMAAVTVDGRLVRAIAFEFDKQIPEEAVPGLRRFATRLGAAAAQVEARAVVNAASTLESGWLRYADLAAAANRDVGLRAMGRELVEAGAAYVPCGRLSVTTGGRKQRVLAISGIERYAKRAESVTALQTLATVVARGRQTVYSGSVTDTAPQVQQAMEAYLDLTTAKSVAVAPLRSPQGPEARGVVVLERFDGAPLEEASDEVLRFIDLAEAAMQRATRLRSVPLLDGVLRTADRAGWFGVGWLLRRLIVLGLVVVAAAWMVLGRGELTVEARGELTPRLVRHVFSPADGMVESVHVRHGDEVAAGTPFVTLTSNELTLRLEEAFGELTVVEEELANLKTAGFGITGGAEALQKRRELSGKQKLLKLQRDNLKKRLALLQEQLGALNVTSPQTGTVVTWDIEKELAERPVRRGDLLGSVADLSGEWVLRLRVPDRLVGHVTEVEQREESLPQLSYIVASEPETAYEGRSVRMSPSSQVDPQSRDSYVLLEAALDPELSPERRLGAEVKARLRCGQQPLYYVWFHQAYEEVRRFFF